MCVLYRIYRIRDKSLDRLLWPRAPVQPTHSKYCRHAPGYFPSHCAKQCLKAVYISVNYGFWEVSARLFLKFQLKFNNLVRDQSPVLSFWLCLHLEQKFTTHHSENLKVSVPICCRKLRKKSHFPLHREPGGGVETGLWVKAKKRRLGTTPRSTV